MRTKSPRPKWYENVPPKQRKEWTAADRTRIYTLRVKEEKDIDEIIDILDLDASRCEIHNQIRLSRATEEKRCFSCRKKLTAKDMATRRTKHNLFLCASCREKESEYKKKRTRTAKNKKLCIACGLSKGRKALPKKVYCANCLSATYRRRINVKMCGRCGAHPIAKGSESLCQKCLRENKAYIAVYREALHEV